MADRTVLYLVQNLCEQHAMVGPVTSRKKLGTESRTTNVPLLLAAVIEDVYRGSARFDPTLRIALGPDGRALRGLSAEEKVPL